MRGAQQDQRRGVAMWRSGGRRWDWLGRRVWARHRLIERNVGFGGRERFGGIGGGIGGGGRTGHWVVSGATCTSKET